MKTDFEKYLESEHSKDYRDLTLEQIMPYADQFAIQSKRELIKSLHDELND